MKNRRVPFAAGLRYFFRIPYQSWSAYSTDVGKIGHRFGAIVRIGSVSTRLDRCEINPKVGRKGANFRLERSVRTICRAVLKIDILPASEIGADQSPPRRVSRPQKSGVTARSRGSWIYRNKKARGREGISNHPVWNGQEGRTSFHPGKKQEMWTRMKRTIAFCIFPRGRNLSTLYFRNYHSPDGYVLSFRPMFAAQPTPPLS